jgi:hypothetical protein
MGPQGIPGPQGPAGPPGTGGALTAKVRSKTVSVPVGAAEASAVSACASGEFATGGGLRMFDTTWSVTGSYPFFDGTKWVWAASVALPDGASGSFIVYAVCVPGTATMIST